MKTRLFLLSLSAVVLLSQIACGEAQSNDAETEMTMTLSADTDETTESTGLEPKDFNGYTFRMLRFDQAWNNMQLDAESETGDTLNDAIYRRNRIVEEECGILLEDMSVSAGQIESMVQKNVAGGTNDFDVVWGQTISMLNMAQNGFLLELNTEVPYINLSKPWWTQSANECFSIINKLYVAVNDISLSYFDSVMLMAMNMRIAEEYQLDDPYELVHNGKWTMDAESKMLVTVTSDINGDGQYTIKDDLFGIFGMSEEYLSLCTASGCQIILKDENDIPYLAISDEKFMNAFEKAISILNQGNVFANFRLPEYKIDTGDLSTFTDGRALFFSDVLYWLSGMRDMKDDFAILPRPKYDESQDEYYSSVHETAAIMGIPVTSNTEICGHVIETLAFESYKTVIPQYYNMVLSQKFARDEDSIEMLDIIFKNRIIDLGVIYNWGNVNTQLKAYAEKSNSDIASFAASISSQIETSIEKMVDAYRNN